MVFETVMRFKSNVRKSLLVKVLAKERAVGQGPCLVRAFRSFFLSILCKDLFIKIMK